MNIYRTVTDTLRTIYAAYVDGAAWQLQIKAELPELQSRQEQGDGSLLLKHWAQVVQQEEAAQMRSAITNSHRMYNNMGGYTYAALLERLGLSNWQFILILLLAAVVLSVLRFLYQMGFLTKVNCVEITTKECDILYTSYEGKYVDIGDFSVAVQKMIEQVFKVSKYFGIMYDHPTDQAKCRGIVGIVVDPLESVKASMFLQNNGNFRGSRLPESGRVQTSFKVCSMAAFGVLVGRAYPIVEKRAEELTRRRSKCLWINLNSQDVEKESVVDISVPLENFDKFMLWFPLENKKQN